MKMQNKIKIKTNNGSYDVLITQSLNKSLISVLNELSIGSKIFVVIDSNVFNYHSKKINKIFGHFELDIKYFQLKANERTKSLLSLEKIYRSLAENNFGKDTLLISIGGGITGDISGFAAATYMRGIQLIHIPTTITSAVDSAIGGKTGVNFLKAKNLIGSFYQPKAVLIDTGFFATLPLTEIRSGIGEIIKYGYLSSPEFYNLILKSLDHLQNLRSKELNYIIQECIHIKSAIVSMDETETGLRKILNFGHTFAHAFESCSGFKIKHGEAVAAGIVSALFLSSRLGFLNIKNLNTLLKLPISFGVTRKLQSLKNEEILNRMKLDKKNRNNEINFILLKNAGELLVDVRGEKSDILWALDAMKRSVLV